MGNKKEGLLSEIEKIRNELALEKIKNQHLQKISNKFNLYSDQTPFVIIDWDIDFQVKFWNLSAEKLFGYKQSEALNETALNLITSSSEKKKVAKLLSELISGKAPIRSKIKNITKDGKDVYCDWYNTPLVNENGEVTSITSLIIEIPNRTKAENSLLENREGLKTLVEASFEGILFYQDGHCIEANTVACELFAYDYSDILGCSLAQLFEIKGAKEKELYRIGKTLELVAIKRDGTNFHAEVQCKPYKMKDRSVMVFAIRNIDERIKAKYRYIKTEEKFWSIFEHAGDGILLTNLKGKILEVNQSFGALTGFKPEELINRHFKILFCKKSLLETPLRFDLINNGKTIIDKWNIVDKEKNSVPVEINLKKINDEYMIINFRDLSERILAEQAIRESNKKLLHQKEKAELSDRLKSEFLANMSHEIRTPMNGILGFADMLNDGDLTDEDRQHYVNIIMNSGQQLKRIIDDILEISELETNQIKVVKSEISINNMFLELFSIFDKKARENRTPLYLKKGLNDEESKIYSDELKLRKILNNLIDNAIHYTQEGFIEVGYRLEGNRIKFYVKDTGIGIRPEMQKIIFERFAQEDKSLARNYGGLGLGLSIAKENAILLNGQIGVESEKGEGSCFYFTIPYEPVNKEKVMKNIVNKEQPESLFTVLIAEDEEVNYLYLETLLKRLKKNISLLHARNGQEAVDYCRTVNRIDLVLMDIKMPVLNGLEATKIIKEILPELKIIAQTAYSRLEDQTRAREAGCDNFLSKPINKEKFIATMREYIY